MTMTDVHLLEKHGGKSGSYTAGGGGTAAGLAVPAAVSRQAAERMGAAECRILPGGHLMHEESPDGLSGVILDWLQGLPAPRP